MKLGDRYRHVPSGIVAVPYQTRIIRRAEIVDVG